MKKMNLLALLLIVALACQNKKPGQLNQSNLKLWYTTPAADWNGALPLGNGRLGAMVFGIPGHENIQLNEATLCAGGPNRNDNPKAKKSLSAIRNCLFNDKTEEALNI
ncbi:glycoside hydrolase N-terminal domain-containing protein, partial [Labilibaculum sp.]|uniref:glycoside hydrolase N-terminal domain-containing protein n=1 Tax=Labilibaculum sp. TaxID=2060723 RepID=UPI003568DB39